MNTLSPFRSINCSCDEALQWAKKQFSRTGLRVVQTFDLHTTRLTLEDCPCPHHGTNACDCQMVVLLVYGSAPEPATLILHGNDGQTWLSLIDRPGQQVNKDVTIAIQQALDVKVRAG